jgi:hypothetical protein
MLLHSNTLFWFRDNQSLILLISDECLEEMQKQWQFYSFWFDTTGVRSSTPETKHYLSFVFQILHDISEILLKVALNTNQSIKSISFFKKIYSTIISSDNKYPHKNK